MKRFWATMIVASMATLAGAAPEPPLRQMENLGRGVVAVRSDAEKVFVSWRLLESDPDNAAFNVYRATAGGKPKRLNPKPLQGPTHFIDISAEAGLAHSYFVRGVVKGREQGSSRDFVLAANMPPRPRIAVIRPR